MKGTQQNEYMYSCIFYLDEIPASQVKSTNLLADLLQRFYAEQDHLIGLLRSPDFKSRSERERQVPLVMLKIEKAKAEKEFECFDMAAPKVGLTERVQEALITR